MTITTQNLLGSSFAQRFDVWHLDTSDHRGIDKVARIDLLNILLAMKHGAEFLVALLAKRPGAIYLPLARNRLGVLRDLLFLLPARLARRPVVVHFHSSSFFDYWHSETALMRRLISFSLGPKVTGIVLGEIYRDAFGPLVPSERIHVVPNGIPDLGVGAPPREREPMVLHLSTMWTEKGLFEVLRTAVGIRARVPEARFVLAGGWYSESEKSAAMRFVAEHGLAPVIEFVGPVEGEEKRRLLQTAAAMLFPSKREAQSLVVLEALSAGTPVVATPVGCLPETYTDGVEGFFISLDDIDGLIDRCTLLLIDVDRRDQMGRAARRRYESHLQVRRFARELGDVVESVLRNAPQESDLSDRSIAEVK